MNEYYDLNTPEITALLLAAPVYRKGSVVVIRPGIPGELVITRDKDGSASCTIGENQSVITNPGREQYVIDNALIPDKYDPVSPGSHLYRAKGLYRLLPNPAGRRITIRAPWGGKQEQGADCLIAARYFPDDPGRITADRYLLGRAEFGENDYEIVIPGEG